MAVNIRIDIEDLQEKVLKLGNAINDFEPYSTRFIDESKDCFKEMNSDFTQHFATVLDNMRDSKAPKLLQKLKSYQKAADKVVKEFEALDYQMSLKISGKAQRSTNDFGTR